MTEAAAKRIVFLLSDEPKGMRFRVQVLGGGCSGFQYRFDLDAARADDDKVIERGDAEVVIDETSLGILGGSVLDYVEQLGSAGFEIRNPNATARCGCGNSFSI